MSSAAPAAVAAGYRIVSGRARSRAAGVGPRAATPRVGSTSVTCTTPTGYGGPARGGEADVVDVVEVVEVVGAVCAVAGADVWRVASSESSRRDHPNALAATAASTTTVPISTRL